jgi:REP element-mobilizing transposase RayT
VNRQVHDRGEPDGRERKLKSLPMECKYHVVFIPKCRRRTLYKELRKHLGEVFRRLASQKENRILEGDLMPYHVHMLIAIPPKYDVSQVIGCMRSTLPLCALMPISFNGFNNFR